MCWVCDEYGEGMKWFLNPKNHGRHLYTIKLPGQKPREFGTDPELEGMRRIMEIIRAKMEDPKGAAKLIEEANRHEMAFPKGPFQIGQALTLKEAQQIAEISYPIAMLSCICRIHTRAREERSEEEYSCTGLGVGMFKWERWPERYKGGVHFMDANEAKEWLAKWDNRGLMHLVMSFGATPMGDPYVGGLCNCDYPDCLAIRHRLDYGLELGLLKGHYVAKVNYELCNGCGICVQRCQFGVAKFEVTTDKLSIDAFKCFGCGLCETGCPRGAITMLERVSLPGLKEVW